MSQVENTSFFRTVLRDLQDAARKVGKRGFLDFLESIGFERALYVLIALVLAGVAAIYVDKWMRDNLGTSPIERYFLSVVVLVPCFCVISIVWRRSKKLWQERDPDQR